MPSTHAPFSRKGAFIAELLIIIGFALVPLFVTFPYRVNIFLSWEGAYRLSQGQVPYKDFGLPLGYGFWLMPALFFKIFGPQLISLVKAQVFMNILAGLSFRSILKSLNVQAAIRVLSVLLFVLSYSFFNFWPWYNQTVIVYELIGLAFLFRYLMGPQGKLRFLFLFLAAFFTFLSFFTKQDGGGLALLLSLTLLAYNTLQGKKWLDFVAYLAFYGLVAAVIIVPLLPYGFGYWFNHGQAPHNSRLSVYDILSEIMGFSQWIKLYFLLVILCLVPAFRQWRSFWNDRPAMLFALLTLGILVEAAIFQVTSYTPPDNNIFFHSFAFAFIASRLQEQLKLDLGRWPSFGAAALLVLLWWSGSFWKYLDRIVARIIPPERAVSGKGSTTDSSSYAIYNPQISATGENVVSRNNFMINTDTTDVPTDQWIFSDLWAFHKIYMPPSTVHGMTRLQQLPVVKEKKEALKLLNMTELTPLAQALPYKLETGSDYPLWYHLGVGMFNRQLYAFAQKIQNHHYDVVLYEYAPGNNNFFPFALRHELQKHYRKVDEFLAPRRPTNATIEVYVKE
ncbi:hypothetical protein [Chitinophaga filiformis]|uniref:Dolichyl-phosphate-mannose-protein mannosyltransferase n=1 Tax=Chitinophaga filiformis TaxID=104663 RepID=A0A1G7ZIT6_CHIFI|nr:hypothetical protein [Chitinophaga filiformis]SDH08466.1 hypothetical protein SAMN04488121_108283 [Chitinophaga filiformis]